MPKTIDLAMLIILIIAIVATYSIKHQSAVRREKMRVLENAIAVENDSIDLLKAQWALLVQPSRIKNLSSLYQAELQLQPTDPVNLISFDDLLRLKWRLDSRKEHLFQTKKGRLKSINIKKHSKNK
ncbi:MAG: hypothetical protein EU981_02960 [Candidatus Liberibacter ctenarytainae]|uniref:Cell division protein FtsL n=1 Tax=Candidatus Liberibacter ctenarytainae TaxID=2020335 RepID=A0A937AC53_9HYPH|nr:hypothetical protein [Candidatus Liberibacter ctenarytainae]